MEDPCGGAHLANCGNARQSSPKIAVCQWNCASETKDP